MKSRRLSNKEKNLAHILYSQAITSNTLKQLEIDIEKITETDSILTESAFNSKNSPVNQSNILYAIFKQLELGSVAESFVNTLIKNHQIYLIFDVARNFQLAIAPLKGKKFAEVISAIELTDSQIKRIEEAISHEIANDVFIHNTVDNNIIGGIKIKIGNYLIDDSVEGYIKQFMNTAKGA